MQVLAKLRSFGRAPPKHATSGVTIQSFSSSVSFLVAPVPVQVAYKLAHHFTRFDILFALDSLANEDPSSLAMLVCT